MGRVCAAAFLLLTSGATAMCGGWGGYFDGGAVPAFELEIPAAPSGSPAEPGTPKEAKDWTVIVYISAKNYLESGALEDFNEMEAVGSGENINIVAELGRPLGYTNTDGNWSGVRRYLVQKDANPGAITSPVLWQADRADMGDWRHLAEFAAWAMSNYPAKHYMLILRAKGTGWSEEMTRGVSYDYEAQNYMSVPELGKALAQIGHVDIFAMDAGYMQSAETVWQLAAGADYIAGSTRYQIEKGYDYKALLSRLAASPGVSPEQAGGYIVDSYINSANHGVEPLAHSLIKTAGIPAFSARLRAWIDLTIQSGELAAVKYALEKSDIAGVSSNKDLRDFMKRICDKAKTPAVAQSGRELLGLLGTEIVVANRNYGLLEAFGGITVYGGQTFDYYSTRLFWSQQTGWDKLLGWAAN